MTPAIATPAIALRGIDKRFGAVHANRSVDLTVEKGSIHGIVGENGAGKSTLMSILYGYYEADAGEIRVDGRLVAIRSPKEAIAAGIGMVHQHFMLVDPLSVLDNLMLGAEGGVLLACGAKRIRADLARFAREEGLAIDPGASVGALPVALRQRVEILKALIRDAAILILDEPTAVLTPDEADRLFALLRALAAKGKTVILITHKLREIMAVTDRVSVMRRGEMAATLDTAKTNPAELAELMVGRRVLLRLDKEPARPGPVLLAAEGLTLRDERGTTRLDNISFGLRGGEIVGIAGIAGNGQGELLETLAGMRAPSAGVIRLGGEPVLAADPGAMRARGVLHIPEDRLRVGLVAAFEAFESAALGFQHERRYGAGLLFDRPAMIADAGAKMDSFDVRPRAPRLKTARFSGGNQQKIILAREMERGPRVLLVGQPTRGVDIGAIEFIHRRLLALRAQGVAILLVSAELEEIMALSDRILVLCAGRVVGERLTEQTNERDLGLLMAGIADSAAA